MATLNTVLLLLHIVSGASWFGGLLLFAMVVGPTIGDFTPATSGEVVTKLLPKILRYMMIFVGLTPILGLLIVFSTPGGMSTLAPTTTYGMFISAGAFLSLLTWVVFFGVAYPTGRKIIAITEEVVKKQTPAPPDLPKLAMRLKISAGIGLVLLVAILICMVAATS